MATRIPSNLTCEQAHFALSAFIEGKHFKELPLSKKEFKEKCPGGTCTIGGAAVDFRPCLEASFFASKKVDLQPFDAAHGLGAGEEALKKASAVAKDAMRSKIATYITGSPS